jgi:hypothetical protein
VNGLQAAFGHEHVDVDGGSVVAVRDERHPAPTA